VVPLKARRAALISSHGAQVEDPPEVLADPWNMTRPTSICFPFPLEPRPGRLNAVHAVAVHHWIFVVPCSIFSVPLP
jgi:hypothetical protein